MVIKKTRTSKKTRTYFGVRYGFRLRKKYAAVKEKTKSNVCIVCGHNKVKRVSLGIWLCKKCGAKFAGKAYTTQ